MNLCPSDEIGRHTGLKILGGNSRGGYKTGVEAHKLLDIEEVLSAAPEAKQNSATRFCMGAAWRSVKDNREFDRVLEMLTEG